MQVFTSEELQRRPAEVQQSALVEPTFITFHGRPRLVMMSLDEFERLQGRRHQLLEAASFGEDVLGALRAMAASHEVPETDLNLLGGLLGPGGDDRAAAPA